MDEFHGKIDGPHRIERDLKMSGMITEQAIVSPGVELILHGMITGDLIAESGSRVTIHGMVNGAVRNRGASIVIHGWIDELDDPAGTVVLKPGARVRGKWGGPQ